MIGELLDRLIDVKKAIPNHTYDDDLLEEQKKIIKKIDLWYKKKNQSKK